MLRVSHSHKVFQAFSALFMAVLVKDRCILSQETNFCISSWCRAVESGDLHGKQTHKDFELSFERRSEARTRFSVLRGPAWFLGQESPVQEGKGPEPAAKP